MRAPAAVLSKALDRAVETLEANGSACSCAGKTVHVPAHTTSLDVLVRCDEFECVQAERAGVASALADVEKQIANDAAGALYYLVPSSGPYSTCRRCPAVIAFGTTAKGKRVPLDLATMREVQPSVAQAMGTRWEARTHFQTCPAAASFTRKQNQDPAAFGGKRW